MAVDDVSGFIQMVAVGLGFSAVGGGRSERRYGRKGGLVLVGLWDQILSVSPSLQQDGDGSSVFGFLNGERLLNFSLGCLRSGLRCLGMVGWLAWLLVVRQGWCDWFCGETVVAIGGWCGLMQWRLVWLVDCLGLLAVWFGSWAWNQSLGPYLLVVYFIILVSFCFVIACDFSHLISLYQLLVGLSGFYPGQCTLCALSALVRWHVDKWTLPPSGRMKRRATETFGWLHSGEAVLIGYLWLCFGLIFPVCRLYCQADGVASDAMPAK